MLTTTRRTPCIAGHSDPTPMPKQETFRLGNRELPRLFNGLWQLSSNSWGCAPAPKIRRDMATFAENGYTAFGELNTSMLSLSYDADLRRVPRHGEMFAAFCGDGDRMLTTHLLDVSTSYRVRLLASVYPGVPDRATRPHHSRPLWARGDLIRE